MSILFIIILVFAALIVALQILKVLVDQRTINIIYGILIILLCLANSGWVNKF